MRIAAISDTHGHHQSVKIPQCDLLIHAGDFTARGIDLDEAERFLNWLSSQPAKIKILVPGNHDGVVLDPGFKTIVPSDVTVLVNDCATILLNGRYLKIYGSAWTPEFCDWYFMKSQGELLEHWRKEIPVIQENGPLDILICHGPPTGILDEVDGNNVGCDGLLEAVDILKPRLAIYGHLHENKGRMVLRSRTLHCNVSYLDEYYRPQLDPMVIDL